MRGRATRDKSHLSVSRPELLVDGSDHLFINMLLDLYMLRSRLHAMREKFGESLGLGGIEYVVLGTLIRLPAGEVGVQELADRLQLSGAFTTSTVNVLVEKHLVEKTPHPTDKRRVLLAVTPLGQELFWRLLPVRRQVNDTAFEPLTAAQFQQLCDTISRLNQSAERAMALQDYLLKAEGGSAGRSAGRRRAG